MISEKVSHAKIPHSGGKGVHVFIEGLVDHPSTPYFTYTLFLYIIVFFNRVIYLRNQ